MTVSLWVRKRAGAEQPAIQPGSSSLEQTRFVRLWFILLCAVLTGRGQALRADPAVDQARFRCAGIGHVLVEGEAEMQVTLRFGKHLL